MGPVPNYNETVMENFVISDTGVKVFKDYRDNITIDRDNVVLKKKSELPREKYNRGKVKGLSRFGSENSEDIKSWNLFRTLQLQDNMNKYYNLINVDDLFEGLLFWGMNVETGEFDKHLKSVLDKIEPHNLWNIQQTEPDVIIIGRKTVIFNESKLGRRGAPIDAWNRKDSFSKKHELYKENAKQYFKEDFIDNFNIEGKRYYQLMRNYIVGINFANLLNKEFHLAVIVSNENKAKSGLSHEEEFKEFCSLLKDSSNCHFLTWEQFN